MREAQYSFYSNFLENHSMDKNLRVENVERIYNRNVKLVEEYYDEKTGSMKKRLNTDDNLIEIFIRLENKIDYAESSGYTLAQMLSDVGGLASILYASARVTTRFFSEDLFFGSLIEVLFRLKTNVQ